MQELINLELVELKTKIDEYLNLWKRQNSLSQPHVVDALLDIRNTVNSLQEMTKTV